MQTWVYLVIIYGILMAVLNIFKKKALTKSTIIEVLWAYSLFSFLFVSFEFNSAMQLEVKYIFFAFLKAICMFASWILGAQALNKLPISLHGVLNLSRIIFSTIWGVIFLNEKLGVMQILGMLIVIVGLGLVNLKSNKDENGEVKNNKIRFKYVLIMIISCVFATISGLSDIILMKNMESGQLQFWAMLFITILYTVYSIVKRERISIKNISKNYWIIFLAICLIVGDRALFAACAMPESKLSVMALIKQTGVIVTVLVGGKVFKEKNILYRFFCALIALSGIALVVMS